MANELTEKLPKVSIFIICYNQQQYIAEALTSAINQDYENLEIVVSDDGSSDNTQEILKSFSIEYPEKIILLLNPKNIGISANCNRGLKKCSGKYIALFGGDDILLPGKISAQIQWFRQNRDAVLCTHRGISINANGTLISGSKNLIDKRYSTGLGPINLIKRNYAPHPTSIMVLADSIPMHGFDETIELASDYMFLIEVLINGGKYGDIDQVFAKRRIHNNSVSNNYHKMLNDLHQIYDVLGERYPKYKKIAKECGINHVVYTQGINNMKGREWKNARSYYSKVFFNNPLNIKVWIRIIQTYLHYNR